jgi:hypothetical protein
MKRREVVPWETQAQIDSLTVGLKEMGCEDMEWILLV